MTNLFEIRDAVPEDIPLILRFIKGLAEYEKAPSEVTATEENLLHSFFENESTARALICSSDGEPVGFAVYFYNYSTWQGRKGLYLEDLFILPDQRGRGAGSSLLKYLARKAMKEECGRFEWSVLDWNEPAIRFYESIGAKPKTGWLGYRLDGDSLIRYAGS